MTSILMLSVLHSDICVKWYNMIITDQFFVSESGNKNQDNIISIVNSNSININGILSNGISITEIFFFDYLPFKWRRVVLLIFGVENRWQGVRKRRGEDKQRGFGIGIICGQKVGLVTCTVYDLVKIEKFLPKK